MYKQCGLCVRSDAFPELVKWLSKATNDFRTVRFITICSSVHPYKLLQKFRYNILKLTSFISYLKIESRVRFIEHKIVYVVHCCYAILQRANTIYSVMFILNNVHDVCFYANRQIIYRIILYELLICHLKFESDSLSGLVRIKKLFLILLHRRMYG